MMPALPYKDTDVRDGTWDAGANVGNIPAGDEACLRAVHAWVDPKGDPKNKGSYKLPHHFVDSSGTPGAASISGVNAAMARVNQANTDIPAADKPDVMSHLKKHQDKYNASKGKGKSESDAPVMPRLALSLAVMSSKVWSIVPEVLQGMYERLSSIKFAGGEDYASTIEALKLSKATPKVQGNGVAVVPITGMIVPKLTIETWFMGADQGLDDILGMVKSAIGDPDVKAVVMDINSPGGLVDGVPEAGAELAQLRQSAGKPIVAVSNHLMASAAYWLGSQAHEVIVSPSAEVGSVGVYQLHKDMSGALERMGVKPTLISAGKYKVEGNPFEPLEGEARQAAQQAVDDYYGMFTAAVATGRSHLDVPVTQEEVQNGYGEGRVLTAKRAVKANLADREATLGDTISRLSSGRAKIRRTAEDDGEPTRASDEESVEVSPEDRHRLLSVLAEMGVGH